jgi:Protein of unknown function (DUF4054)
MSYIFPTVDDFRAKFPEFADLDDAYIQVLLDDAGRAVDQTWTEGDYTNAILFLAAHYHELDLMASAGSDAPAEGVPAGQTITAEHIGPISVTYGKANGGASSSTGAHASSLDSTVYGQRYQDLLIKNIPAVLVI